MEWLKSWWYGRNSGWRGFSPYSRWDVKRNAWLDGSLNNPLPTQEDLIAPWYLGAMKEHFDNIVRGIGGEYQERDAPLQSQEASLTADKEIAERESVDANAVYQRACNFFEEHNPGLLPDTQAKHTFIYWIISFALFILEFPMNFAAFQMFGDRANLLTALTTLMIAGILIGSAHFMGIEWRRGPFANGQSLSVFIATLVMPILAIAGVATLRALHFSHQTNAEVAKMPPSILFASFTIFNLGIYMVAALLSRWAHPAGAEQVIDSRKRLRSTRRTLDKVNLNLRLLRCQREVLHGKYTTEAHRVTDQHFELTKRYLMENVRVRQGDGVNGSTVVPKFLEGVNVSTTLSLPWMFSRRPSLRDKHEEISAEDANSPKQQNAQAATEKVTQ